MVWFAKKQTAAKRGPIVALESLSSDILAAQLTALEEELHAAGFQTRRLEFPSGAAETNIPGLLDTPGLLKRVESLGLVAALDRARTLQQPGTSAAPASEVVLLTGSQLGTAAWLASAVEEYGERVALYRWLSELEYGVFNGEQVDLTVYIDTLPQHLDVHESALAPVGWGVRVVPEVEKLRDRFLEAAKLLPGVKTITAHKDGLLKPDFEIKNELWNLVRRIALKSNLPPKQS
jgi:hypothetical protein